MADIPGTSGANNLTGTSADDTFTPLGGNDTITGGGGFDTLDYRNAPGAVIANMVTGVAQDGYGGTDTFTGISAIVGSASADTLTGALSTV